jgi:hypothetical protein
MRFSLHALLLAGIVAAFAAAPASHAADNAQQQRMKDCNAQASGMSGAARQKFMSSCLSNKPESTNPNCNPAKSKPCGNSCIALDKVCHK